MRVDTIAPRPFLSRCGQNVVRGYVSWPHHLASTTAIAMAHVGIEQSSGAGKANEIEDGTLVGCVFAARGNPRDNEALARWLALVALGKYTLESCMHRWATPIFPSGMYVTFSALPMSSLSCYSEFVTLCCQSAQ